MRGDGGACANAWLCEVRRRRVVGGARRGVGATAMVSCVMTHVHHYKAVGARGRGGGENAADRRSGHMMRECRMVIVALVAVGGYAVRSIRVKRASITKRGKDMGIGPGGLLNKVGEHMR